ncbi:MAG: hypothetical protein AAFR59_13980, partial [Bacteroidota bacterium]
SPLPEQDCIHALPICQSFLIQPLPYVGAGFIPNEINPQTSCMYGGERNAVWYRIEVQESGWLAFVISALDGVSDFDWALYDLTGRSCGEIYTDPQILMACNYGGTISGCAAETGLNDSISGVCSFLYEDPLWVQTGQVLMLNISNYDASPQGFSLDFAASTAHVLSPTMKPQAYFAQSCEGQIKLSFDREILLDSLWTSRTWIADENGHSIPFSWEIDTPYQGHWGQEIGIQIQGIDTFSLQQVSVHLRTPILDRCGRIWSYQEPISAWIGHKLPITRTCSSDRYMYSIQLPPKLTAMWNERNSGTTFTIDRVFGQWVTLEIMEGTRCIIQERWRVPGQRDFFQEISAIMPPDFCAYDVWEVPLLPTDDHDSQYTWSVDTMPVKAGQKIKVSPVDATMSVSLDREIEGCQDRFTWDIPIHPLPLQKKTEARPLV